MDKLLERFNALGMGEKIILVAGVVLFIDGFLPWYNVDLGIVSVSRNGWESPGGIWSILAVLIGLAMAGVVAAKTIAGVAIPEHVGGLPWPKIHLPGGVAAPARVLIKLLNESSYLGFAFYVGIIATLALA